MPELPEVETLRRHLHDRTAGTRIIDAWADPAPKFASACAAAGMQVVRVGRRGKYLIFELDGDLDLVIHLGMTGQLLWDAEPADHVRAWFRFDAGTLWFRDPRRFGRALLARRDAGSGPAPLAGLGPEPLQPGFTIEHLLERLGRPGQPVKARLLDQRLVAGIGNYLADEALFAARIHPQARYITATQAAALHAALIDLVSRSIAAGGMSTRDYVHLDGSSGRFAVPSLRDHADPYPGRRPGQHLLPGLPADLTLAVPPYRRTMRAMLLRARLTPNPFPTAAGLLAAFTLQLLLGRLNTRAARWARVPLTAWTAMLLYAGAGPAVVVAGPFAFVGGRAVRTARICGVRYLSSPRVLRDLPAAILELTDGTMIPVRDDPAELAEFLGVPRVGV